MSAGTTVRPADRALKVLPTARVEAGCPYAAAQLVLLHAELVAAADELELGTEHSRKTATATASAEPKLVAGTAASLALLCLAVVANLRAAVVAAIQHLCATAAAIFS